MDSYKVRYEISNFWTRNFFSLASWPIISLKFVRWSRILFYVERTNKIAGLIGGAVLLRAEPKKATAQKSR